MKMMKKVPNVYDHNLSKLTALYILIITTRPHIKTTYTDIKGSHLIFIFCG